uniref:WW domain-containing protein n=1 Tax=Guillardia theta TaxID=55529 RepID=A0A6U6DDQ0_GUITH|mmetsp:Transcript_533/g.1276  ORF Transcript_533/g.1276 Transcript_533/m.1276 type:complete len:851 (+) Transcript_533:1699-4251(+)
MPRTFWLQMVLNPLLNSFSANIIAKIVQSLKNRIYIPNQFVLRKGVWTSFIFFVASGAFEIVNDENTLNFIHLMPGFFSGENCLIRGQENSICNIRAADWSNLLILERADLDSILIGHDDETVWLLNFCQMRWPLFKAVVSLCEALQDIYSNSVSYDPLKTVERISMLKMDDLKEQSLQTVQRARSSSLSKDDSQDHEVLLQDLIEGVSTDNVDIAIFHSLFKQTAYDSSLVKNVIAFCRSLVQHGDTFDLSIHWLASEEVMQRVEQEHQAHFPRSQLVVECMDANLFETNRNFNPFCRICFIGSSYETLTAEYKNECVWNETFVWSASHSMEGEEIRAFVFDYVNEATQVLIGMCDIQIDAIPPQQLLLDKFPLQDLQGFDVGHLRLSLKYTPLQIRLAEANDEVGDFTEGKSARFVEHLIPIAKYLYEQVNQVEAESKQMLQRLVSEAEVLGERIFRLHGSKYRNLKQQTRKLLQSLNKLAKVTKLTNEGDGSIRRIDAGMLSTWKKYESPKTGRSFWMNKYTRAMSHESPSKQGGSKEFNDLTAGMESCFLQDLPGAWIQKVSRSTGLTYFQNVMSGETSWKHPAIKSSSREQLALFDGVISVSLLEKMKFQFKVKAVAIPTRAYWADDTVEIPKEYKMVGKEIYVLDPFMQWRTCTWKEDFAQHDKHREAIQYAENQDRLLLLAEVKRGADVSVGFIQFKDGFQYYGQMTQELPHGFGIDLYPDSSLYSGEFSQGARHGFGYYQHKELSYTGYWHRGKRHGVGIETISICGYALETFTSFSHGILRLREKLGAENSQQVSALRKMLETRGKQNLLWGEKARLIAKQIASMTVMDTEILIPDQPLQT